MEETGKSQSASSPPPLSPPFIGIGPGTTTAATENGIKGKRKRKLPSAKEMVAHYESQGMETQEASLKAIEDLQNLLFKVVTTKKKMMNKQEVDLNVVNSRLLRLESKLDSKPGYAHTLAIGVASGALLRVLPQVAASLSQIWNSVRATTSTSKP